VTGSRFSLILWATDVGAMARFLVEVAGMELEEQHPGYASLGDGTVNVMVHADEAYRGHPWYDALKREGLARGIGAEMRVLVEDAEAAYRRALHLGGQTMYAPYYDNGYMECQVLGPDGYLFSLWSPARRAL
jgi:hypothetical protein